MLQSLALFLEKLMLVFVFLLIYFTIQHLEYIQDEVRHTVRVQQVSHFFHRVWFFVSYFLIKNFTKVAIFFHERYWRSSPNIFELVVLFLTPSICLQSERWNFSILLKLFWSLGSHYNWLNGCINKV